jgi:hypothetical protein
MHQPVSFGREIIDRGRTPSAACSRDRNYAGIEKESGRYQQKGGDAARGQSPSTRRGGTQAAPQSRLSNSILTVVK